MFIMKGSNFPTVMGMIALVLWSTGIAFTRSISEHMGTLNTAFFSLLFSGLLLLIIQWIVYKKEFFKKIANLPFSYLYKAGSFWVIYEVSIYLAVGEATSREAVIVVGIINYLWPGLIFLFSVLLLKNKVRPTLLILGIFLAFSGTVVALMHGNRLSLVDLLSTLKGNLIPYAFAFVAAVSWGLYSNLVRKYKVKEDLISVPLLFVASGGIILVLQLFKGEVPSVNLAGWEYLEFAYFVIFSMALGYLFWFKAMRDGKKEIVTAFSYLGPLVSTLISGLYLKVKIGISFWAAALMVILGAVLCKMSIRD